MRHYRQVSLRAPLFSLLLLAGCDRDPAELAQEINAAREGCTEADLRAGSEACVQMMERYAEMGTEAIGSYIGAVKALDQALKRMPAAQFDTSGVGHAISPEFSAQALDGASPAAQGAFSPRWNGSRQPGGYSEAQPRDRQPYPQDRWYGHQDGYTEGYYDQLPYGERYPGDPYRSDGSYDPGYPEQPGSRPWPRERGGRYDRPRPGTRPYDPRYDDARSRYPQRDYGDPRMSDPRMAPPARGQLLPPEQRLRRPWLEDERYRDPRWRQGNRMGEPGVPLGWEEERYPPRPRYPR